MDNIKVTISNDKLEADVFIDPSEDISTLSLTLLEEQLASHNIVFGIEKDVLKSIVSNPKDHINKKVVVARGIAPVPGENAIIKYLYDPAQMTKGPKEDASGRVDYRQINTLNNVRKGQILAERIAPTEGQGGTSVEGKPLPAKDGKDVRLKLGKNVISNEDHTAVYATIDGLVSVTENTKLNVFAVYEIKGDIDYGTGNIDFVGTVVIRGSVLDGFKVKSTGDIHIHGNVEGAELDAGGSIEINAGVMGHNRGHIRAGANIKVSFIQDANVMAGGDIIVAQSIMHSNIKAGKNVYCKSTKGLIIGGHVQAGQIVAAKSIGNTMATNTHIEVGMDPEIRNNLSELKKKLKDLNVDKDKTSKTLNLLNQMAAAKSLPPEKMTLKVKLANTLRNQDKEEKEIQNMIAQIEESINDDHVALVTVQDTVHEGVKITIGKYVKYIRTKATNVTFKVSDSDISMGIAN